MIRTRWVLQYTCCLLALVPSLSGMAQVTEVQPRICRPGESTVLKLAGKDIDSSLRVLTSHAGLSAQVESVTSELATVRLTLPVDANLGPMAVWTCSQSSLSQPWILVVDDLPNIVRGTDNVSLATAQQIPTFAAISGVSRGNQSDFYRFEVSEGQRVAFEVLTQLLESPMDPVARLYGSDGQPLATFDDDGVGPEPKFSYQFKTAGMYILEIRDSRYASGGLYHLRIGDFPILATASPMAVQRGQAATIDWMTTDGSKAEPQIVNPPLERLEDSIIVATKQPNGQSSAWSTIGLTDLPVRIAQPASQSDASVSEEKVASVDRDKTSSADSDESASLSLPFVVYGHLTESEVTSSITFHGMKDQTVRFQSRTRSLGSHAVLKMQLFRLEATPMPPGNSSNSSRNAVKVAETSVSDADEWSFDYKFPDDSVYRLDLTDLLSRSGASFGYVVEAQPLASFHLALKGDATTPLGFLMEAGRGARAIDLLVNRDGYEGEIELKLQGDPQGLELYQHRIPASSKEARTYLIANSDWTPERFESIRLVGLAANNPQSCTGVRSSSILQLQRPYIPFPAAWNNGRLILAGTPSSTPLVALTGETRFRLARPVKEHSVSLSIQRLAEDFKGNVTILPHQLPAGWSASFTSEKDVYAGNIKLESHSADVTDTTVGPSPEMSVSSVQLLAYAEHNQRGIMQALTVPIEWFDPIAVELKIAPIVYAGTTVPITVQVIRQECNQPVSINWQALPTGIDSLEPVTLAADQTTATINLTIPANFSSDQLQFGFQAASRFEDQDFAVAGVTTVSRVIASPQQIEVFPAEVVLENPKSHQQLVITGIDSEGRPRDWTLAAAIQSANPEVAEVKGSVIYPRANGEAQVVVRIGTLSHSIPVRVSQQETEARTQFESEVLVALSKQGCNSGACHGSPSGKGMFRLSLRAFDSKLDELTLIREDFGRRINAVEPEESLLLLKPLMRTSHGGGRQLRTEDAAYRVLLQWIREGGQPDPPESPRCVRLEVFPNSKRILQLTGGHQQVSVIAHFADGSHRDVTNLVSYESSNMQVATVDPSGLVRAVAKGEAVILARYLEHIESIPLTFIDRNPEIQWRTPVPANYVDEFAFAKLQQMDILPADTCSDAEFLRRVHLDLIGLLPSVDETRAFLSDRAEDKRSQLIDRLLEREEYAKFWSQKWGDLLRLTGKLVGGEGVYKYHRWLEEAIRTDLPYDQFARELITASGSTLANPPANFYRTATDMNECVETVSQVFLGARLQCAKCHNHPFERWTQDNYYGLAAFFHRVQRRKTQRPDEMFIWSSDSGDVTQPRTGQSMQPWLPVTGTIDASDDRDRRRVFADWLTESSNPYFARIGANRIWSQLFSRGIVEPVDDFRDSNPPTNPALLDALAEDFRTNHYSTKHLLRSILNSRTYQASSQADDTNRKDELYFSHQHPRLLKAEQLLDALNHVTGIPQQFGPLPGDAKATQLPAPDLVKVDFLKVFGQPERSTVCACERTANANLAMAIELFNGPLIHQRLSDSNNRFHRGLAAGKPAEEVLDELYLAALCRLPTDGERAAAMAHLQGRSDSDAGFEDICWALINTDEFLFQH